MPTWFEEPDLDRGGGWGEAPAIVPPRHLDRALAFARFSRRARVILQQVAEACWGADGASRPPGAVSCPLDIWRWRMPPGSAVGRSWSPGGTWSPAGS